MGFVTGGFSKIGTLQGGTGTDLFTFVGTGLLSGGLDGGAGPGFNSVTGPDLPTAWTVTAMNAGDVTATNALTFDSSGGVATQPTVLTLAGGHGLKDGESVRYSNGGAADAHGLTNGSVYFVVVLNATQINLQTQLGDPNTLVSDPDPGTAPMVQLRRSRRSATSTSSPAATIPTRSRSRPKPG